MNPRNLIALLLALASCCIATSRTAATEPQTLQSRSRSLCFGWKFVKGDPTDAHVPTFEDSSWRDVQLPHDWSIAGPKDEQNPGGIKNGFFPGGIGWYRKHFRLPPADKNKKVFVEFDGIYHNSEVWINGHSLGRRPYGYISFQYDLTPYVKFGAENVLAVRVDNSDQPNCRWYTGSGIYRDVRLTVTNKLHVPYCGTYVTTPSISAGRATVRVRTEVQNSYDAPRQCELITQVLDPSNNVVAENTTSHELPAHKGHQFEQDLVVTAPILWSIEKPALYTFKTIVKSNGQVCDEYQTPFGIREFHFDKDHGFVLNGQQVKLKGVNIHHDAGSLGAAVPVRAWERRLEVLKSIGCNAIRMSHNPPAPELLDLCDRLGFVVIDEAFDKWDAPYGRWFADWWQRDLTDMIRRDRNHPSIIMWSVGNELTNQGQPAFIVQLQSLVKLTRELDPTRPVTVALKPRKDVTSRDENAKVVTDIARLVDVISLNYQEQWFEDYRRAYPEIIIIASESYPYYRGKDLTHKAFEPLNPWLDATASGYVAGTFYWTGIDYLGEAEAGWPYHGWNCSLIDTCGYVRPFANLHKSFWTSEPMVHIAVMDDSLDVPMPVKDHWGWPKMDSHWNLPQLAGKSVKVVTFTNCPTVELLLNGKSLGTKNLADFPDKMITWSVPYEPGRFEARGLNEGEVEATHELRTAGEPAKIRLSVDRSKLKADGRDLSYIDVQITDKDGTLVPNADPELIFSLEGPGMFIGIDNGDLTSMESYHANPRKAFHGRAQAVLQSTFQPGPITITVQSDGLPPAQATIKAY